MATSMEREKGFQVSNRLGHVSSDPLCLSLGGPVPVLTELSKATGPRCTSICEYIETKDC